MRLAKISLAILAMVVLSGYTFFAFNSGVAATKIDFNTPKLQSTEAKLKSVNIQYETLNSQLNKQTSQDKKKIEELKKHQQQLEKQREDLQKQVEAKAAEKQKIADAAAAAARTLTATSVASADTVTVLPAGSHQDWMAAAGISAGDYGYADYIVMHEGHYCPTIWNGETGCPAYHGYSTYKAYGVCQALSPQKMASAGDDWDTNPITQLRWCNSYAVGRYGSWANAYQYWLAHHLW